jgi:hypothetical protein
MDLCQYADIFGKPNQGVHSTRIPIFNIALVDTVLTIVIVYFLVEYFDQKEYFYHYIVLAIFLSVIIHKLFCVDTTLTKFVFR